MKTQLQIKWLLPVLLFTIWISGTSCKETEQKISVSKLEVSDCSPSFRSESPYPEEEFIFEKINDFSYRIMHKNLLLNCDIDTCTIKIVEEEKRIIIYESSEVGSADCLCPKDISFLINSTNALSGYTVTIYYNNILCHNETI